MRRNCQKPSSGFSLIEIMIYTIILGMFLLLVTQIFISVKTINANSLALVSVQTNYRQVLADLTREVRAAGVVTQPVAGGTSSVLSLDDGTVIYQLEGGVLVKTASGESVAVTTDQVEIESLIFTNPVEATQSATVKVEAEMVSRMLLTGGNQLSETISFSVGSR